MAQNDRQAAEWRLIEKAWKDDGFRKELLADPGGTVRRELGVALPASVKLQVIEETPDTFVLVIPSRPDKPPAGQLSTGDLEQVAGGWDTSSITCQGNVSCGGGIC